VDGEFVVCAAESGNEMIFEGLDGPFGSITAMDMWWHQLEIDGLCSHEFL